jgi:Ran GTPase-activating protein (RanGAP) involved in mRNA processing and transport
MELMRYKYPSFDGVTEVDLSGLGLSDEDVSEICTHIPKHRPLHKLES